MNAFPQTQTAPRCVRPLRQSGTLRYVSGAKPKHAQFTRLPLNPTTRDNTRAGSRVRSIGFVNAVHRYVQADSRDEARDAGAVAYAVRPREIDVDSRHALERPVFRPAQTAQKSCVYGHRNANQKSRLDGRLRPGESKAVKLTGSDKDAPRWQACCGCGVTVWCGGIPQCITCKRKKDRKTAALADVLHRIQKRNNAATLGNSGGKAWNAPKANEDRLRRRAERRARRKKRRQERSALRNPEQALVTEARRAFGEVP